MKPMPVLDIATHTGIPASRIYRWISAGRLRVVRPLSASAPMTVDPDEVLELEDIRVANGGYLPLTPT